MNLAGHDSDDYNIETETIKPVNSVRDLGLQLDGDLSMKQHINAIARTCFYHLQRLCQIRRQAGYENDLYVVRSSFVVIDIRIQ